MSNMLPTKGKTLRVGAGGSTLLASMFEYQGPFSRNLKQTEMPALALFSGYTAPIFDVAICFGMIKPVVVRVSLDFSGNKAHNVQRAMLPEVGTCNYRT